MTIVCPLEGKGRRKALGDGLERVKRRVFRVLVARMPWPLAGDIPLDLDATLMQLS